MAIRGPQRGNQMIQAGKFVVMVEGIREPMFAAVDSLDDLQAAFVAASKASSSKIPESMSFPPKGAFVMQVVAEFENGNMLEYEKPVMSDEEKPKKASTLESTLEKLDKLEESLRGLRRFEQTWVVDSLAVQKRLNELGTRAVMDYRELKEKSAALDKRVDELEKKIKELEEKPLTELFSKVKTSKNDGAKVTLTISVGLPDGATKTVNIPCPNGSFIRSVKCSYDDPTQ